MQNNDTFTSIPTTTDTATSRRPRLLALVGGVIAVGGLTFGIGAALAQESDAPVDPAFADHAAIAEWASSNGLSGLSPASLAPVAPVAP